MSAGAKEAAGEPAFPFGTPADGYPGMTRRQWYAGQALIGMAGSFGDHDKVARACFAMADAMIAAENAESQT